MNSLNTEVLQSGIFLKNLDILDKLEAASLIKRTLSPLFDSGTVTVLPIPEDAPPDIPRIILSNKENGLVCNISLNRIDFIINLAKQTKTSESNRILLASSSKLVAIVKRDLKATVYRLTLISQFRLQTKKSALEFIKKMTSEAFSKKAVELQIHRLTEENIAGFKSNHWLRLLTVNQSKSPESLVISSDLNTHQSEKYDFDTNSAKLFFQGALSFKGKLAKEIN